MMMRSFFNDDLFDSVFGDFARPVQAPRTVTRLMSTDVKENEDSYELRIELPGCKKEDVQASLKDGCLTVKAETRSETDENTKYLRRERFTGTCSRSFYVGDKVKQSDISAAFEDGILSIRVAKPDPKALEENSLIAIA